MSKPKKEISKPPFNDPELRLKFRQLVNAAVKLQCILWDRFGEIEGLLGRDIQDFDANIHDLAAASDEGLIDDSQAETFFNELEFTPED
jgi:hypothetical protein